VPSQREKPNESIDAVALFASTVDFRAGPFETVAGTQGVLRDAP
jgi:hypothetical protein